MILTDAGPIVALIDGAEPDHERCVSALVNLPRPMATTWPAFTEAMHLLGRRTGWLGQERLWDLLARGRLRILDVPGSSLPRVRDLMRTYREVPMDLADATLVALAEARKVTRIFTLDSDFAVYRLAGGRRFEAIP